MSSVKAALISSFLYYKCYGIFRNRLDYAEIYITQSIFATFAFMLYDLNHKHSMAKI